MPLLRRLPNTKNSEARELRHDIDNNQTNKLEWWMILKISLRAKAGIPKTLVKQKISLTFHVFPSDHANVDCLAKNPVICILVLDFVHFAIEYLSMFMLCEGRVRSTFPRPLATCTHISCFLI